MDKTQEIPQALIDERALEIVGRISEAGLAFTRQARAAGVSFETLQELSQKPSHLWWKHLDELAPRLETGTTSAEVADWQSFYKKFFDVGVDLSAVRVPKDLDRTLMFPKGISINLVVKAHIDRNITFWKYTESDLESVMRESERGLTKAAYAIRVRNCQEADKDLKNLSAEMIAAQNIDTESLLERLIHGLKYFDETGKHLDVENITLCARSRYSVGFVPDVRRNSGGDVFVYGCSVRRSLPDLRARRAVRVG